MKRKILALLLILVLTLSLVSCKKSEEGVQPETTPAENPSSEESSEESSEASTESGDLDEYQQEFAAFVDEQYKTSIEESYYMTHTYYKDPAASGLDLDNIDISLGLAPDDASMEEDRTYYKSLKEALDGFDRSKLTRSQQDEYDSLEWEIGSVLNMTDERFDYYEQLFAPPNSLDTNMFSIFSTWELNSEKDAQDVITFMNTMPAYIDSCIEYAKKQQEKELLITNFDDVIKSTQDVIDKGTDSFVIKNLNKQVDNLQDLDDAAKTKYKEEIAKAYEASFIPSFQKIVDGMNEMKGGYNNTEGLAAFPNGKEYYAARLNYLLGSSGLSVEEIKAFLEERLDKAMDELRPMILKFPDVYDTFYSDPPKSGYKDYVEILEDIKVKMLDVYPEVKDLEYNIELADPEERLSERNVGAYFLVPPIDASHLQQMRVNPDNEDMESIETYITVTHEGFPGHMYQFAYMADHVSSPYIRTLEVDAMVEGYAVYSQYQALEYLADLHPAARALFKADDRLGYLEYSMIDIGINYEGWDVKDTKDYFINSGYSLDDETIQDIYDYLRGSPGSYFPYGPGYEYIAQLREKAEEKLGSNFDLKEFNRALLNAAPTPRVVVERYIDEYVSGK